MSILDKAANVISGDRKNTYGDASESFGRIAAMWSAYLGIEVSSKDVAMLMVLMKVSRHRHSAHEDDLVDIAGYAALCEGLEAETLPAESDGGVRRGSSAFRSTSRQHLIVDSTPD